MFVRSLLENSCTVWHSSLTRENREDLERIQKCAVKIILKDSYTTYENALLRLDLDTLEDRRKDLCKKIALRCIKNPKTKNMFPENTKNHNMKTRKNEKFIVDFANTERLKNSSKIYMQTLLNKMQSEENLQETMGII